MLAPRQAFGILVVAWIIYAVVVVGTWGLTYWDFGDGNYLYIASRVNAGVGLYREILAPQPPLHVLVGCVSERLGTAVAGSALIGVRVWCLIARLLASWLVFAIGLRLARDGTVALAAGVLYLMLPIGFWWSLGYQSENLEIVFLLFALWQLTRWTPRGAMLAGVASALAMHTNMTAVPYFLVNVIFLLFRRRDLLLPYAGVALGVWGAGALAALRVSDGFYWNNVVANQVGTFPRTEMLMRENPPRTFWDYAFGKIAREGFKVLSLEGPLIAAAAMGIGLRVCETSAPQGGTGVRPVSPDDGRVNARESVASSDAGGTPALPSPRDQWHATEFLAWSAIGHFLSICFTAKGGTVDYIFVIGEPFVALFAADVFVRVVRTTWPCGEWRGEFGFANTRAFLRVALPIAAIAIAFAPSALNVAATLREQQCELPAREVEAVRAMIQTYAQPGDPILAPPFYAFISGTTVAGELSENYIWQMKYANERFDNEEGFGVRKMQEVALMLDRREIPVVLLDLAQTGRIPEIAAAIERNYQSIESKPLQTMNTQLGLFIPKNEKVRHKKLME